MKCHSLKITARNSVADYVVARAKSGLLHVKD